MIDIGITYCLCILSKFMFFAQLLLCLLPLTHYEMTQGMLPEVIVLWKKLTHVPSMTYFIYDPPLF